MESALCGRDRVPLLVRPVGAGLIGPGVLSPAGHVTVSIPEGPEDPAGLEGIVLPVVGAGPADLGIHDPLVSGFHKNHLTSKFYYHLIVKSILLIDSRI